MVTIKKIKEFFNEDSIIISRHCLDRMNQRNISFSEIKEGIMSGEIIEQYPGDYPFPSRLVYGHSSEGRTLHIVISDEGCFGHLITAYVPNTVKFINDLKTRRKNDEM